MAPPRSPRALRRLHRHRHAVAATESRPRALPEVGLAPDPLLLPALAREALWAGGLPAPRTPSSLGGGMTFLVRGEPPALQGLHRYRHAVAATESRPRALPEEGLSRPSSALAPLAAPPCPHAGRPSGGGPPRPPLPPAARWRDDLTRPGRAAAPTGSPPPSPPRCRHRGTGKRCPAWRPDPSWRRAASAGSASPRRRWDGPAPRPRRGR